MLTRVNSPEPDSAAAPGTQGGARSDAQLVAGTMHDDVLLVHPHAINRLAAPVCGMLGKSCHGRHVHAVLLRKAKGTVSQVGCYILTI